LSYGSASRLQWELAANSSATGDFDQVSAASVTVTNGAKIDLFLNRASSTVDFTDPFWSAHRPGYTGLTRRSTIESSTDLTGSTNWQPVPGSQAIAGAGQSVTTTQLIDLPRRFYRLKAWLE